MLEILNAFHLWPVSIENLQAAFLSSELISAVLDKLYNILYSVINA